VFGEESEKELSVGSRTESICFVLRSLLAFFEHPVRAIVCVRFIVLVQKIVHLVEEITLLYIHSGLILVVQGHFDRGPIFHAMLLRNNTANNTVQTKC
jgi:hypothetical protein